MTAKKKRKVKKRRRSSVKANRSAKTDQEKLPIAIPPDALRDIRMLHVQMAQIQQRADDLVKGVLMGLGLEGPYKANINSGQFLPVVSVEDVMLPDGQDT